MLNIITSLSPRALADDMLQKIRDCWTDPFVSPVIVFTDSKTEQWFKLHVLENRGVPMNLRTARLESFLFDLMKTDAPQALLSPDLLRDVIMQKLLSRPDGQCYLEKIKGNDNIEKYLNFNGNMDDIDYKHLFEFANDLSKLFIEYEATRENIDVAVPGTDWQKDLYNEIINDGIIINDVHYYTCPELAEKNRCENDGKIVFNSLENQNIFVFGFSGMGQTYRRLLKELSNTFNVCVYLQVPKPCASENLLLKHFAQFGQKNHELFDANNQTHNILALNENNTMLGRIQNAMANDEKIDAEKLRLINDESLTIIGVPSKIKEIEIVHSSICKLLKEKNANLKDILVLAPDIDRYKSVITTVFNQIDETDPDYPFVPFSIVDYSGKNSAVLDVLQTLYLILHNNGFSRKDFFSFTKNTLIQNRYKITDNDVSNVFQSWIKNMRVFRAHGTDAAGNSFDDWESAVNRLLIAKLTDKPIYFSSGRVMPFSDFNTEDTDNDWLTKFVKIFDDVKNKWVRRFQHKRVLESVDIEYIQTFINELVALSECDNKNVSKEKYILDKINRKLEQYKLNTIAMPLEYVLLSLIDIASNVKFNTGTVFTRGVTFTSLLANRILPAKYVFLIGMGSDEFPGTNNKIALDRRSHLVQIGDDDVPSKNKNAFLCQFMGTTDELHISFVNKDLQTDNTFYPSCALDILTRHAGVAVESVGIDEKRDWDQLYTPRERMNKKVYINLNDTTPSPAHPHVAPENPTATDLPDVVRLTEFRYFIENPLKCYTNRVFGFEEEDTSCQELEDVKLGPLEKYNLQRRLIKPLLDDERPRMDDFRDLLPNEPFDKKEYEAVKQEIEGHIALFRAGIALAIRDCNIDIKPNYPIHVRLRCDGKSYDLRGDIFMCAYTENDVFLYVNSLNSVPKHQHELYALIAQIAVPDHKYRAHIISNDRGIPALAVKISNMTKQIAEDKLNQIYRSAFIENNRKYIPFFERNIKQVSSLDELKRGYFNNPFIPSAISNKDLLDPDTDLGFSADNFYQEFKAALNEHDKLISVPETKE